MATFAHDPTRVHPPASAVDGGYPSVAKEAHVAGPLHDTLPRQEEVEQEAPRTTPTYSDGQTLVSVALGGSGEPHRIVYITTAKVYRNQGLMRAKMEQILADMDYDERDSTVILRNTDVDCDVPRLQAFFESLGYAPMIIDIEDPAPQLHRPVNIA